MLPDVPGSFFAAIADAGGWTVRGTAKVLADRLQLLRPEDKPDWMEGLSAHKIEAVLTRVICEIVQTADTAEQYIEAQCAKGREFDEVYTEVKALLKCMFGPLREELREEREFTEGKIHVRTELVSGAEGKIHVRAELASGTPSSERLAPDDLRKHALRERSSAGVAMPGPQRGVVVGPDSGAALASSSSTPVEWTPEDLEQPLLLVCSCNGWSVEDAARTHAFSVSDAEKHESVLSVRVPPGGLRFQILSAAKRWEWRLHPTKKGSVGRDRDRAVRGTLARSPDSDDGRDFKLKGSGGSCIVDLRVSLSLTEGAKLWFTDPPKGARDELSTGRA